VIRSSPLGKKAMDLGCGELSNKTNASNDYVVVGNVIYLLHKDVKPGLPDHSMFEETTLRGMYVIRDED